MSPARTLAVARRILAGLRRDHRALGLVVVAPIVITLLLAWVIRGSEAGPTNVIVRNDAGAIGARLVDGLLDADRTTDQLQIVAIADSADAARAAVRSGTADVALILPSELASPDLVGASTIVVVVDGTDPGTDAARIGAVQRLLVATLASSMPGAGGSAPTLAVETVFLSPEADSLDILAPVFLGYFAYFFVFILTGISFLRERTGGTLERLLATPVTRAEIVVGYGIGFSVLATVQVILLTAFVLGRIAIPAIGPVGEWGIGLGVASAGSPLLAFVLVLLLAIGAVNLGIFLSTFARNEFQIMQFIPIVIIPQGFLAGIFWPVDRLPEVLEAIARVLPLTYAVDGLRGVILRGEDLASAAIQLDLAVLSIVAVVLVVLGSVTIKREVV